MSKKIITSASTKVFGLARLNDGVYPIKSFKRFLKPCDTSINENGEYEVLALFVDDAGEDCLELNGFWRKRKAIDSNNNTITVSAGGTLYDRLLAIAGRKTFDAAEAALNSSDLIGKTFRLSWKEYTPANSASAIAYVPQADLVI